jgi:CheY-like chemotaxis protein
MERDRRVMKNASNLDRATTAAAAPAPGVLVADDSPVTRRVMCTHIATIFPQATIIEAATGGEACEALKTGSADIAFVDMEMPDMNGVEAVALARQAGARPFVTLMAQQISPGWEASCREIEAYEILEKPLEESEIRQILMNYLRMNEQCRVLVADDSKTFRQLIRKVIASSRFRMDVDVVDNGEGAISLLGQQSYDVVFLDYEMPGLDGLETACLVQEVSPTTRVVMVSANHSEGVEKAARYFGAVDFLKKPFYPIEIDKALHLAFDLPLSSLLARVATKVPSASPV